MSSASPYFTQLDFYIALATQLCLFELSNCNMLKLLGGLLILKFEDHEMRKDGASGRQYKLLVEYQGNLKVVYFPPFVSVKDTFM